MKLFSWWHTACSMCVMARHTMTWIACCIVFAFSVYGATTAWNFANDDLPAIELGEGFSSVKTAVPGETVVFYLHVRKLRDCQGRIIQVLTGDCGYIVLNDSPAYLTEGFDGRVNHVVRIPFEAMPGNCAFRVKARYTCNLFDWPLQRQVFESKLIPFTVISNKNDGK
jgi:hypothetical protein